ncbi:Peptidase_G2, IMC autoproteolytic cleavage domain [Terribacillus aidingensis]|uniref:Peptidase_G2, IMC autoproteolytic cleavage domain n=1 Tax=Terribacillus aidingensis TaxID=586416 RepID=A0A285NKB6_9BACI|nr:peptidase G2 autoproteolytic cleavage domain-containing protein [Terribacillus aidingensis]SNZ09909.1 Peptidase_G2, IMC autoproteolytic cleavage domain [Terribacillus aidingensis]
MDHRFSTYDRATHVWKVIGTSVFFDENGNRFTPEELQEIIDKVFEDITTVNTSLTGMLQEVDNTLRALESEIGDISQFKTSGITLVEKIINEFHTRSVNVQEYGAVADANYFNPATKKYYADAKFTKEATDNTAAFEKALGTGRVKVFVPGGNYMVQNLKIPSYVKFYGAGAHTKIMLHHSAPRNADLLRLKSHTTPNMYIYIEDMTLDCNRLREATVESGDGTGCGLRIVNGQYIYVNNVHSLNPYLHGFDVTSPKYNSSTDSEKVYQQNGCKYVWINNCTSTNFGDDGFTTHFSDFVFLSNCRAYDANGDAHHNGAGGNSNGFEADDGSKHVWFLNCLSENCSRGYEVKAHSTAPAGQNVHLVSCVSKNDCRSFDLRHIGFHTASAPVSTTAFNVTLTNCTSITPYQNDIYPGLSPRALVISAYRNVSISNFTAIGDPSHDYKDIPVVAFQYKSSNITVNGINIRGFKTAGSDIYVTGGAQKADFVSLSNVNLFDSARVGIRVGSKINSVKLIGANLQGSNLADSVGIWYTNSRTHIVGVSGSGYKIPARVAGSDYTYFPNILPGGFRAATSSGQAVTDSSAVIASTSNSIAGNSKSAVIASSSGNAGGEASAVIATTGGATTGGARTVVMASSGGSQAHGSRAAVIASNNSQIKGDVTSRSILSSNGVKLTDQDNYSVAGGYGTGEPSRANIKWYIDSMNGNITSTGQFNGGSTFSDFAEYFESKDGKSIPSGTLVTIDADKVRPAQKDELVIGAISETAAILLGGSQFHWQGRYKRNEFGGVIYEQITDPESGEVYSSPVINPNYVESADYVPRSDRPEWNVVGLQGQLFIRVADGIGYGDYLTADNGVGVKSTEPTKIRVMKLTSPYNATRGYGIALCLKM